MAKGLSCPAKNIIEENTMAPKTYATFDDVIKALQEVQDTDPGVNEDLISDSDQMTVKMDKELLKPGLAKWVEKNGVSYLKPTELFLKWYPVEV